MGIRHGSVDGENRRIELPKDRLCGGHEAGRKTGKAVESAVTAVEMDVLDGREGEWEI
jgi:hypothetical protein